MVFHPLPSEISHGVENENQDIVTLPKNGADVDKRGAQLPEEKGFMKSTEFRKWQSYMDKVKKWEDSRLPWVGGCMR
jgi:hypothetical protein